MSGNRYFPDTMLDVLCHPDRWRLVSTLLPAETAPVQESRHTAWMPENTHAHAHRELLLIVQGQGYYGFNGHVYPCTPGTVFLFDAQEPHDLNCPPWAPDADHLWIGMFSDQCMARLLPLRQGRLNWSGEWSTLLAPDDLGIARLRGEALPAPVVRMQLVAAIALQVTRLIRQGYADPHPAAEPLQQRVVETIRQYLQETAGNGVSLDSLARLSGYSKFHFLRLFERYTGQSVFRFIEGCRLRKVHEMQAQGYSQKAIAYALGFSCPSSYARWYRRWRSE